MSSAAVVIGALKYLTPTEKGDKNESDSCFPGKCIETDKSMSGFLGQVKFFAEQVMLFLLAQKNVQVI